MGGVSDKVGFLVMNVESSEFNSLLTFTFFFFLTSLGKKVTDG